MRLNYLTNSIKYISFDRTFIVDDIYKQYKNFTNKIKSILIIHRIIYGTPQYNNTELHNLHFAKYPYNLKMITVNNVMCKIKKNKLCRLCK